MLRMETDINGERVSLEFDMNTSRAKWNATVDEELNISKSYKKVTLQEFVEVLVKQCRMNRIRRREQIHVKGGVFTYQHGDTGSGGCIRWSR